MTTWVAVTDSHRARIFSYEDGSHSLAEVTGLTHPLIHAKGENPTGRIFAGQTGTRHGLEPATLPKEKEKHAFAVELTQYLQQEFLQEKFSRLILVAEPDFMGEVRDAMSDVLSAAVIGSIAKDLVSRTDAEIANYLRERSALH